MKGPLSGQRDDVHLLPGEDEALQKATVPEMKDKVPVHRTQRRGPDEQRVKQKLDHLRQQQQQQQQQVILHIRMNHSQTGMHVDKRMCASIHTHSYTHTHTYTHRERESLFGNGSN